MDNTLAIVLAAVAVVIVVGAILYGQQRRSKRLRDRYGAEYRAAVDETGDKRKAETELRRREKRVDAFELRPLSAAEATRFSDNWRAIQAEFVDDPGRAIGDADALLGEAMKARGYPVADFEQRADDLSVSHPQLVSNYRIAHDVADRHAAGQAGTEDLRRALIHYRALFDEVVHPGVERLPDEPRTFSQEESDHERPAAVRAAIRNDSDERRADDRAAGEGRRSVSGRRGAADL
jgi:hypothetical protein